LSRVASSGVWGDEADGDPQDEQKRLAGGMEEPQVEQFGMGVL
jgi:hypothetical protein